MDDAQTEARPKMQLSAERLAKMAEGRRLAYERKRLEKEEAKAEKEREKEAARAARRNGNGNGRAAMQPPPAAPTIPSAAPDQDPLGFMDNANPVIPDFSGSRPKSLLDLFNSFPIGDGAHFIQVDRKTPKHMWGQQLAGIQRQIREPITDEEFASIYGGGEFELRVYRMDLDGNGAPRSRPLTEPIKWAIPGLPNPEAANPEENDMQYVNRPVRGGRIASPPMMQHPDVQKAEIEFRKDRFHRDDEKEQRERERREAAARERDEHEIRKAEFAVGTNEKEIARLEAQNQREVELAREAASATAQAAVARAEAEAAAARAHADKPQTDPIAVLMSAKSLFANDDKSAISTMQNQITQMSEAHKNELARVHKDHEMQLKAERDRADLRIKDAEERAERRIGDADSKSERLLKEAEERTKSRVAEIEERSKARIAEVELSAMKRVSEVETRATEKLHDTERRCDERIRDLGMQWETRLKDQERNHDRELRSKESELGMSKTSVELMLKSEIAQTQSELKRVERELGRAQHERDDYKLRAENWLEQMEKFKTQAEAMGYVSADEAGGGEEGPKDWKSMLMQIATNTAGNFPEILRSAGEAVQKIRAPGVPADVVRMQGRQQMAARAGQTVPRAMAAAPAYQPLPFATEDGPSFPEIGPAPTQPPYRPMPVATSAPPVPPMQAPVPAPVAAPAPQPPAQAMLPMPLEPNPAPPPTAPVAAPSVAPPAPNQAAQDGADVLINGIVASLEHGVPAEQVATEIAAQSDDASKEFFKGLTFEQITIMLGQRQTDQAKKLTRREGQKYLREIWGALHKLLAEPAQAPAAAAS